MSCKIGHFWPPSPSVTLGHNKEDPPPYDSDLTSQIENPPPDQVCHTFVDPLPPHCVTSFMNVLKVWGVLLVNRRGDFSENEISTKKFFEPHFNSKNSTLRQVHIRTKDFTKNLIEFRLESHLLKDFSRIQSWKSFIERF